MSNNSDLSDISPNLTQQSVQAYTEEALRLTFQILHGVQRLMRFFGCGPRLEQNRRDTTYDGGALWIELEYNLKRWEASQALYAEAMRLSPQTGPLPDHPTPATFFWFAHMVWGCTLLEQHEMAARAAQEALRIRKQALGPDHPGTAIALMSLGTWYQFQGHDEETEWLMEEAIRIHKQASGRDHPDIATCLIHLVEGCEVLGHGERAKPLLQEALRIRKQALGSDHPVTAAVLMRLGAWYQSQGHNEQAEPLLQEALRICQQKLDSGH